VLWVC